jgi:hypothetical protein
MKRFALNMVDFGRWFGFDNKAKADRGAYIPLLRIGGIGG